ncbi:MAG TPA: aminoglycoside phosphotransferase family protein [Sphingobacteriaceae bacterium]
MLDDIIEKFGINTDRFEIQKLSSGLINNTWKIGAHSGEFVLQQINTNVFKSPDDIAENINRIAAYLSRNHPDYRFVPLVKAKNGEYLVTGPNGETYRFMPYVKDSLTLETVKNRKQAFEAARQFGKFTANLVGFDTSELKMTLPDFHNLLLRFRQFEDACNNASPSRLKLAEDEVGKAAKYRGIVETYRSIVENETVPLRVIHHDTKISNVLFNADHCGICVIDLDTVMPGYFFSDVGDMMRTYLSPSNEEETDLTRVMVREDFFSSIIDGYLSEMSSTLTDTEKALITYSGKFMIYMQAIRFLTDYLNGDVYYPTSYPEHNLNRARNQFTLLQSYLAAENTFSAFLAELTG